MWWPDDVWCTVLGYVSPNECSRELWRINEQTCKLLETRVVMKSVCKNCNLDLGKGAVGLIKSFCVDCRSPLCDRESCRIQCSAVGCHENMCEECAGKYACKHCKSLECTKCRAHTDGYCQDCILTYKCGNCNCMGERTVDSCVKCNKYPLCESCYERCSSCSYSRICKDCLTELRCAGCKTCFCEYCRAIYHDVCRRCVYKKRLRFDLYK